MERLKTCRYTRPKDWVLIIITWNEYDVMVMRNWIASVSLRGVAQTVVLFYA